MERRPRLFALVLAIGATVVTGAATAWELDRAEQTINPEITETVWTASRGDSPHDRIALHRYRRPAVEHKSTLLYLPGTNMNGQAALSDSRYNLWLWLAERGVEVFTLDYRTHTVLPDHDGDRSFMRSWTMDAFAEDATVALAQVARITGQPASSVFVAGFSRGASFAYTTACLAPEVAGVIALDGYFKSSRALAARDHESLDEVRRALEQSGQWASDVAAGIGWAPRAELMRAVAENPDGPATQEGYSSIGEQLASLLYSAWGPGRLAHPVGSPSGRGITRPEVLARLMANYDRFYPSVQNGEGQAIGSVLDHPDTPIDDCFGEIEAPVLFFGSSGMGADWLLDGVFSATRSGSKKIEIHVLEGYGHLDVLVAESAVEDVFEPVYDFIARH